MTLVMARVFRSDLADPALCVATHHLHPAPPLTSPPPAPPAETPVMPQPSL